MKHLTIIRHAQAEAQGIFHSDFDRALTVMGKQDAKRTARKTVQNGFPPPDVLIASPALRTMQTAHIFADAFRIPRKDIRSDMRIYSGTAADIETMIFRMNSTWKHLMLIGHNPAVTELVMRLCPQFGGSFHPCSVAVLEFSAPGSPPLLRFYTDPETI